MLAERILKISNTLQIHEMERIRNESPTEIRLHKSMVSVIEHGIHSRTVVISNNQGVLDEFKDKIQGNIITFLIDEMSYGELSSNDLKLVPEALKLVPDIFVLDVKAVNDKKFEGRLKDQGYTVYTF